MSVSPWTESDTVKAKQIWSDYEQNNDLTNQVGQAAGIDPVSGRIWFGNSAKSIVAQLKTAGLPPTLLFFVRVGSDFYLRKGGRR